MFYNSLTVWEKDVETEIREIAQIGVKHVLLVAFDRKINCLAVASKAPEASGRHRKVGAKFESIFVDTSVMNGPARPSAGWQPDDQGKMGLPHRKAPPATDPTWTVSVSTRCGVSRAGPPRMPP